MLLVSERRRHTYEFHTCKKKSSSGGVWRNQPEEMLRYRLQGEVKPSCCDLSSFEIAGTDPAFRRWTALPTRSVRGLPISRTAGDTMLIAWAFMTLYVTTKWPPHRCEDVNVQNCPGASFELQAFYLPNPDTAFLTAQDALATIIQAFPNLIYAQP